MNKLTKKLNIKVLHKLFPRRKLTRRKDGTYSTIEIDSIQLSQIYNVFKKFGLKPTFNTFENSFKEKLNKFGIEFDSSLFKDRDAQTEIFIDKSLLIFVEKINDYGSLLLQLTILYESEIRYKKLLEVIKTVKNLTKLREGTYFELAMSEKLNEILVKDSPNGKNIKDKKLNYIFSVIQDHKKRALIKNIAKNLGSTATSNTKYGIIEKLNDEDKKVAEILLNDSKFFNKNYRLQCRDCKYISLDLTFKNTKDADLVIKKGSYICSRRKCHSDKIDSIEVYSVQPDVVKCLGGVWLEKYIDSLLLKKTKYTWPGKICGDDELDNVFIFAEKVFVVECKDASFGMSDLYTMLIKAKGIEADNILILTTQDISKNVVEKVKELNKNGEYRISLVSSNQSEMEDKIVGILTKIQNDFFEQILTGGKSRRRLRLPHIF